MKRLAIYGMLVIGLCACEKKNTIMNRLAAYAMLLLGLFACGKKDQPAPVAPASPPASEAAAPQAEPSPAVAPPEAITKPALPGGEKAKSAAGKHIVAKGDNLYRIAKQHGLNHRNLAKWNDIKDPRGLRVGQELVLAPPSK